MHGASAEWRIYMSDQNTNEPLLDMFLFETSQLLEQLEQIILASEKESCYTDDSINEIFRIMHTIKGSAAMMLFDNIARLAHSIEDLFFYLRKEKPEQIDCSALSDSILGGVDFIKIEIEKIKNGSPADGNSEELVTSMKTYLETLKQGSDNPVCDTLAAEPENTEKQQYYISHVKPENVNYKYSYKAVIHFEEGCEMENIRAYTIIHNLKDITKEFYYIPEDINDSDESIDIIRREGFRIFLKADESYDKMLAFFNQTIFLKDLELTLLKNDSEFKNIHNTGEEALPVLNIESPVRITELRVQLINEKIVFS
jgi:two-component system chemotaxis sensor kinase CheA